MAITPATLHFDDTGTPVSEDFDDFYYSTDNGLEESHYVFLAGNQLPDRWYGFPRQNFVIGESGFGTGLNFFLTWQQHRQQRLQRCDVPRLHFISFEKHPLTPADLIRALAHWPLPEDMLDQFGNQYPVPLPGCHRLVFDKGQVLLDLWIGDIKQTLPQLFQSFSGTVDAWYLDGFAPAKNADMWCDEVFQSMIKLSRAQCTLATFSCARTVRDGLSKAGFHLRKRTGFGKKREMLVGELPEKSSLTINPPFYFRQPNSAERHIAIIGGGIASAQLCYALAKRGYAITLYCKDPKLAQGASQNRQGALYPLLHAQMSPLSEFYVHAYTFALRQYHQLLQQGFDFEHDFCGVLLQAFDDNTRQRQKSLVDCNLWPSQLFESLDREQASSIANLALPDGGLFFRQGGWINPASLIDALLAATSQLTELKLELNHQIDEIAELENGRWLVNQSQYANVAICSGHLANTFSQTQALGLSPIRGQVSHLNSIEQTASLSTVLCYNGYITPALNGQHCIGASFIKGDANIELRAQEHAKNLERLRQGIGNPDWFNQLSIPDEGKAAIRCASIDHLPLAGAIPNLMAYRECYRELYKGLRSWKYGLPPDYQHLYILTALGARGLCSAPLAAEIVAAQINNEPYPVATRVLDALNPGRGFIKQLKGNNPFLNH